ncbi:MAG: MerR family transcriptional regulator [Bacteroidia bacterium]
MNNFSIKDIEVLTGIKPHTLRIWEQRYGIPLPNRTATNIRYYTGDDVKLLLNVAMLNRQGYKISKITKMSKEELDQLVVDLNNSNNEQDIRVELLLKAMLSLDEGGFNQVLQSSIEKTGFEDVFNLLIFPLMARIGVMWQTGSITPAYEHFTSHLIRQQLYVAIASLPKADPERSMKFILFLPPNEPHDITLLFANYMIRSAGYHTNYLGPNLPINDLSSVMKLYKADFILTVLTSASSIQSPLQIANKLHSDFPNTSILLAGPQIGQSHVQYPPKVKLLFSFDDFTALLEQLKS